MTFSKLFCMFIFIPFTLGFCDIVGSKHDLSFSSGNTIRAASGTTDYICVFCHTPHAANSDYPNAPIWNRTASLESYTTYATTTSGTTVTSVSNTSKLCLSCHDGISSINSLINAPGSGLLGDSSFTSGGLVKMNATSDGETFKMPIGASNLGVDLSNSHPISIDYISGRGSLKETSVDLGTGWTTIDGLNKISSLLKNGKVECTSCHDPHLGENTTFLRSGNNVKSKLCLGCHDK